MRVAIFTDTFFPEINGVANTLAQLNSYFYNKGIDAMFFAPDYETKKQDDIHVNIHRIKGVPFPLSPESRVAFPTYTFNRRSIMEFEPDIVHVTTQLGIGRLGVKYAEEFHIPLLMSYHTNFDQYLKFYQLERFGEVIWDYTRKFYNRGDLTLCPSNDCLQTLETKGFKNLGIWSRGIDSSKFHPSFRSNSVRESLGGTDKLLFSYVGRLSAEKDLDIYLESIRIVNQTIGNDKINFVFTGIGPMEDSLRSSKLPNLIVTGPKKGLELSEIYASCDAFVFPSGTETFGNVLLEAMASGLPTISVNSGGVTDFAIHETNSHVCDYHNPQSIANSIIRLATDSDYREHLRQGGLDTAATRSWNSIFNKLTQDYTSLIEKIMRIAG